MKKQILPHNHSQNIEIVFEKLPTVEDCEMVAEIFKQISNGTRLRILWLLMEMSDPAVSHHLKTLKNTGLITNRREGKEIYYKLADTQVAKYIHQICEEIFEIKCPLE